MRSMFEGFFSRARSPEPRWPADPAAPADQRRSRRRRSRRGVSLGWGIVLGSVVLPAVTALDASQAAGDPDVTGLWSTTFQARQSAAECGRWRLDANDFCVADDARNGLELGVRFQTSREVRIAGVRIYRYDPAELRASLWDSNGTLLARGRFADGPISAWQDMRFAKPVTIEPGQDYIASYFSPRTRYGFRYEYFASSARSVGPITALRATADDPNGVHCYADAACGSFPVRSYRNSAYWVTPLWEEPIATQVAPLPSTGTQGPATGTPATSAPRVLRVAPATARAKVTTKVRVTFSEAVLRRSLGASSVRLLRHGHRVPVRMAYRPRLHTVVLAPRHRLRPGATYRIVVNTRIRDVDGNRLDQDAARAGLQQGVWTFRTRR